MSGSSEGPKVPEAPGSAPLEFLSNASNMFDQGAYPGKRRDESTRVAEVNLIFDIEKVSARW